MTATGCAAVKIGGKTAADVFTDPQTLTLVQAACDGNLTKMDELVKAGANVNATGYRDTSVLAWVMLCKSYAGMKKLLELGANPNYKMEGDMSPMWLAAGGDDPRWLPLLLDHGGDPNIRTGYRTALMIAIEQGRTQNVQLLLDHGADVNEHDEGGNTAAISAADFAKFDIVELLLRRGYSYDLPRLALAVDRGATAPQYEAEKQHVLEILKLRGVKFPLPTLHKTIFPPPPGLKQSQIH